MRQLNSGRPTVPDYHPEDPYSILGIEEGGDVDKRYKELCMQFHPDRLSHWALSAQEVKQFADFFVLIGKAKETLTDPVLFAKFKDGGVFDPPDAKGILATAKLELEALFGDVCVKVKDHTHNDFVDLMTQSTQVGHGKMKGLLHTEQEEVARMRDIKRRSGSKMFKDASQKIIATKLKAIKEYQRTLLVQEKMLDILGGCEYEHDPMTYDIGDLLQGDVTSSSSGGW